MKVPLTEKSLMTSRSRLTVNWSVNWSLRFGSVLSLQEKRSAAGSSVSL